MARNKYPEVTVEKILEVSQRLFMERGYDNTTIQDIVNELGGLTKGAIYHHFKSWPEAAYLPGQGPGGAPGHINSGRYHFGGGYGDGEADSAQLK